jgi:type I restriction enzyme M protein
MTESQQLVNKLWNYCNILRDDGLSYGDYVEQLTYLLFLKMDDERTKEPYNHKSDIPKKYNWQSLLDKEGAELEAQYIETLQELGKEEGIIGVIFRKAQNKIQDPAKLRRLIVELINKENWLSLEADVKGDAYEGLLEKNAADVKGGAGQYFTPRPLINAIVEVMRPQPGMKIHDPACGTGGFLLSAYNHIVKKYKLDRDQKEELKHKTFSG